MTWVERLPYLIHLQKTSEAEAEEWLRSPRVPSGNHWLIDHICIHIDGTQTDYNVKVGYDKGGVPQFWFYDTLAFTGCQLQEQGHNLQVPEDNQLCFVFENTHDGDVIHAYVVGWLIEKPLAKGKFEAESFEAVGPLKGDLG